MRACVYDCEHDCVCERECVCLCVCACVCRLRHDVLYTGINAKHECTYKDKALEECWFIQLSIFVDV